MNLMKSDDSILSAGALVALSSLPYWVLGGMGAEISQWISYIVGGAALLLFVVRLCVLVFTKAKANLNPRVDGGLKNMIGFAMPVGVCAAIMEYLHKDVYIEIYLFALLLFVISLVMMLIPQKKEK